MMRTLFALVFVAFALSSCATQPPGEVLPGAPGFLYGLFHGFTIVFAFAASFFTQYEIYAFPNARWPYDLEFLFGVLFFFGGASRA